MDKLYPKAIYVIQAVSLHCLSTYTHVTIIGIMWYSLSVMQPMNFSCGGYSTDYIIIIQL